MAPSSRAQSGEPDADQDTSIHSDDGSSNSGSSSDEEERQTEWLATTREKRSTAGNRLSSLIQQAAAEDDDLELLFAEDEDDVGFEDVEEDASDVQMDSSDDDEDQGPATGGEELEGEKELQREVRAEKQAKKRKANDVIPKAFRKKVKIDPTAPPKAPPPRPKKKSERASWIPSVGDMPTRASARSTTKISKAQLHAQMLDREKRRLRQLEIMEKAQKRKEAAKPKAMTQEDRLAEAARVEKQNSKSLNTWEEAEKKREEEQRAKLEALHNRKLQGPYVTWWSGMAEWIDGKLKRVGKSFVVEEKQKATAGRKRKVDLMQEDASFSTAEPSQIIMTQVDGKSTEVSVQPNSISHTQSNGSTPPADITASKETVNQTIKADDISKNDGLATSPKTATSVEQTSQPAPPTLLDGLVALQGIHNQSPSVQSGPSTITSQLPRMVPSQTTPFEFAPIQPIPKVDLPPAIDRGTWNCLILENFNENSIKNKDVQCQVLFNRKFQKTQKIGHPILCAITAYPAKFRDPSTNLPYCNSYAYKEIQKLKRGEYKWSTLLQAYVGQTHYAARGVPPRFIKPTVPDPQVRPVQGVR